MTRHTEGAREARAPSARTPGAGEAKATAWAGSAFSVNLSGADLAADQAAAAHAVGNTVGNAGGPIAVNALPSGAPGSAAHALAPDTLGSGFSSAFLVGGATAALAAALTAFGMTGVHAHRSGDDTGGEVSSPLAAGPGGTPDAALAT
ncbi:hypothetical protein [Streptomyces sp. NPDC050264]|uniref:hypothetical protein n=1 Tax=Streptomyces sp. NPDC050264 TaxID=3155038 RepID=UPI0034147D4D